MLLLALLSFISLPFPFLFLFSVLLSWFSIWSFVTSLNWLPANFAVDFLELQASQGFVSANIIAASGTFQEFADNSHKAIKWLFYSGLRGQQAFPVTSLKPSIIQDAIVVTLSSLSSSSSSPPPSTSSSTFSLSEDLLPLLRETARVRGGGVIYPGENVLVEAVLEWWVQRFAFTTAWVCKGEELTGP